ncbi:60S acidic ribosomal protein [Musa troglodytarum]|uniref:60S acidic ribosomal protein n=1 Tax=Musa troglodytarum TaxID=320322 RepID=A0A9E7L6V3_9LILI|nr:60S acidic ribosomal protein [Musa troglodytarum]
MGVFTFVCRSSGGEWSAKQLSGDLEASAASTFDLQRRLVQEALAVDSTGGVQSSFSMVSPSSAVFQVIIGGGGGGGAFIGAGAPGGAAAGSGGSAAAPDAPPAAEEKKEEKEESDDDMGFSLFD